MNRAVIAGVQVVVVIVGMLVVPSALADEADDDTEDIPHGYSVDERGQPFQTSFDLQRRFSLGVYGAARLEPPDRFGPPGRTLAVDIGGIHDSHVDGPSADADASMLKEPKGDGADDVDAERHRHRFLQGRLMLEPLQIDARLYEYDYSRRTAGAPIWISTFVGEPRRFDIPIELGFGVSVGRLHYRRIEGGDLALVDIAELRANWELYQSENLEDFVVLSTAVGGGTRRWNDGGGAAPYGFPRLGIRAGWTPGGAGLWRLGLEGDVTWAFEPEDATWWHRASANASAEAIVMAVNDQPISAFLQPEISSSRIGFADIDEFDLRVTAGIRLSLFTPTRPEPAESSP